MLPTVRRTTDNLMRDSLMSQFDNFFNTDHFMTTFFESSWRKDKDGNNVFEMEVPGFNKDNLSVELNNGILTVQGKTETRKIFKRYTIGNNIQDVKAHIADGILSLTMVEPEEAETVKIELTS